MNRHLKLLLLGVVGALAACTDPDHARRSLEQAGYSDIQTGGYAVLGCSDDDSFATRFSAKGPTGVPVTGQVCAGLFGKGSTIRLD